MLSILVRGQKKYNTSVDYGWNYQRLAALYVNHIPTNCGAPAGLFLTAIKQGALYYDSCNARLYLFNPKTAIWDTIKSGGGAAVVNLSLGSADVSSLAINNSAGTGATIPVFSTTAGLAPGFVGSSPGLRFLRADGVYAIPPYPWTHSGTSTFLTAPGDSVAIGSSGSNGYRLYVNSGNQFGNGINVAGVVLAQGGFLLPVLTEAQRAAIGSPATGQLIFTTKPKYYNGSVWKTIPDSSEAVFNTGNQTIGGIKSFSSDINMLSNFINWSNGATMRGQSTEFDLFTVGEFKVSNSNGSTFRASGDVSGGGSAFPIGSLIVGGSSNLASSQFTVLNNGTIKGSVPAPVMSEAQRAGISGPAIGLQVFTSKLKYFDGSVWRTVLDSASAVLLAGNQTVAGNKSFTNDITANTVFNMGGTVGFDGNALYALRFPVASSGTTVLDGGILLNGTAATAAFPSQYSVALNLGGAGWNTSALTSHTSKWRIENRPMSGNPVTGLMVFNSSVNGGSYNTAATLSGAGDLTLVGAASIGNNIFMTNTTAPATPAGGGVLYVESGTLKFKGSSGTVTVIALP